MKAEGKTKAQLIKELEEFQRRINKLEAGENKVKKSTLALKEFESRFRNVFESSKDGIIFFDGKTRKIILGSKAMAKLLGCSKKELVGRTIKSLHPPKEWPGIEKEFQKHVKGEVSVSPGIPVLRKDGTVFYADIRSSLITLDKRSYFSAFFRDTTERRLAEMSLIESREQYRSLTSSEDSMYLVDRKSRFLFMNDTHLSRLGLSLKKVGGRSYGNLHSPEDTKRFQASIKKVLETKRSFQVEHHSERDQKYFLRTFSPIRNAQGNITAVTVTSKEITERKRAEKDLQESEENFRNLAESANDGIMITLGDGTWVFANKRASEITGYSVPDLLKKGIRDLVISDDVRKVIERYKRRMADEFVPSQYEISIRHKDGKIIPSEITAAKTVWQGRPANLIIFRDIAERKRAEEALRESEEKYRNLVERANDGIGIGQDGIMQYANARLADIAGYSIEELVGKPFTDFFMPEEVPKVMDFYKQRLDGEDLPTIYETALRHKDGRKIDIEVNTGIINYKGKPADLVVSRDITERKQAEEALGLAEEKYRAIVENAVEGIFQSTSDGKFIMTNTAVAKFHGYDSPEELIAAISNIGEQLYVHPEERQRYRRILADEGVVKGFETQFYRKDGTIKWGSMNVRSVQDNEGRILHYEGTIEDITARKEAEEGLEKSLEKLRKALGGIIQAMSLTVETRDPYTAGHQRRVADLARAIAQEMGLPEDQVDALRMAGTVHDLGKISIPAEILSKPVQLSDIEFSLIKGHPQISYDILKDIDFNWPVAQIVLQHHERINGSGYPNGLSGKAIYLEARILAVADVVEAISSHRPYRPAYGIDVALEEIEKNKGELYDPKVVDACLKLFREKGFKFE